MRTSTLAVLSSLLITAVRGAPAPVDAGDVSWYDPIRNVTCTGHVADGHISCQTGQIGGGESSPLPAPGPGKAQPIDPNLDMQPTVLSSRAETKQKLEKKADEEAGEGEGDGSTCTGEGKAKTVGCFIHCFGRGLCDAKCDAGDKCVCSCEDGVGEGEAACARSTC